MSWVLAMVRIRRVSSLCFGSQHPEDDQDVSKHVEVLTNCVLRNLILRLVSCWSYCVNCLLMSMLMLMLILMSMLMSMSMSMLVHGHE